MKKHYAHPEKERISKDLKDKISSQRSHIDRFNKLETLMKKNDEVLKAKIDEIYYDLDIKEDSISEDTKMEVEIELSEKRIYEQLRQMEIRLFEEGKLSAAKIEDKLKMEMASTLSDISARLDSAERINISNIELNIKREISSALLDMGKRISFTMSEMKKEIDSRLDKTINTPLIPPFLGGNKGGVYKNVREAMNSNLNKEQTVQDIIQKDDKKIPELTQKSGHTWDIKNSGLFVSSIKEKKNLPDNKAEKTDKNDSFKNDLYQKLLGEALSINRYRSLKNTKKRR